MEACRFSWICSSTSSIHSPSSIWHQSLTGLKPVQIKSSLMDQVRYSPFYHSSRSSTVSETWASYFTFIFHPSCNFLSQRDREVLVPGQPALYINKIRRTSTSGTCWERIKVRFIPFPETPEKRSPSKQLKSFLQRLFCLFKEVHTFPNLLLPLLTSATVRKLCQSTEKRNYSLSQNTALFWHVLC